MNDNCFMHEGQKYKTGNRITCEINDINIEDAKIFIDNSDDLRAFICQNLINGAKCSNRFGYKYSWTFRVRNININGLNHLRLYNPDIIVSSISNIIGKSIK